MTEDTTEGSSKLFVKLCDKLNCVHKSQIQTQTLVSEAAASKTPSDETPMTPDLFLPSFTSDLPKEWQGLAEYASEEEEPQTVAKKQTQPH